MASILESAFRHTCDVKRRVSGTDDTVTIDGVEYEDAMVEILTAAEIFVAGGKAESGGFKCQVAVADFDESPEKFSDITALGRSLKVLSVENINDVVYLITAGDPLIET